MKPQGFRVVGLVTGGETCLIALGHTPEYAIDVARTDPDGLVGSAQWVNDALFDLGRKLLRVYLEEFREEVNRNGYWKRLRTVGIGNELHVVFHERKELGNGQVQSV